LGGKNVGTPFSAQRSEDETNPVAANLQTSSAENRSRSRFSNNQWLCCSTLAPKSHISPQNVPNIRAIYQLGLRGCLSEAELHTLRLRMDAGRHRQSEQGRYQQHVPTGFVRLEDGKVSKTPDLQVQRTLELVFARFEALGSWETSPAQSAR
jgi:hypothetical protein